MRAEHFLGRKANRSSAHERQAQPGKRPPERRGAGALALVGRSAQTSLSDLIRRTMAEALELEAAVGRADREAAARVARLSRLSPLEIEQLRDRGGDVGDWLELDGEAGA
jgi:hypothetical protein